MLTVPWPSLKKNINAEVWRILDLSGITRSVRESKNYTKAGLVYLNGGLVTSLKASVPSGDPFRLELRFPNGRVRGADITIVPSSRLTTRAQRQASPGTNHFINDPEKTNYRG